MSVFHLKASFGSRAGGQSARAKSDYIEREGRYEKDGEELEHKEHGNLPEWAEDDPQKYWEAADEHERANGRLYSEVQFALPKELGEAERRELAVEFAERVCSQERLPYTLAIHRGGANGENPHAHLMFSERGRDRAGRRAVVPALQPEGPGEGRGAEVAGRMRRDPVFDSRIGPRSHFGPASISNLAKDVSVSFLGKYGASLSW